MKKIVISLATMLIALSFCNCIHAGAWGTDWMHTVVPIDTSGESHDSLELILWRGTYADGSPLDSDLTVKKNYILKLEESEKEAIFSLAEAEDYIAAFTIFVKDKEEPYPEIESQEVMLSSSGGFAGGRSPLFGKDYRLYVLENGVLEEAGVEIEEISEEEIDFTVKKLGTYVLYYNPRVYKVTFYDDWSGNNAIYVIENIGKYDEIVFPEIPTKEGYVFTGWKTSEYVNHYHSIFAGPQPVIAYCNPSYYASWCSEEEYKPLEVALEAEKPITKGREDGQVITVSVSDGMFTRGASLCNAENWNVVGSDEISIGSVDRVDDRTAQITLSGNSKDIYSSTDIRVEFYNALLVSEELYQEEYELPLTKAQLDEDGVMREMFVSDNALTIEKQKRSGGGKSASVRYEVRFDTDGGTEIGAQSVKKNYTVEKPKDPIKEGHIFGGWFSDKEFKNEYDFGAGVTRDTVVYAKWEKEEKKAENQTLLKLFKFIIERIWAEAVAE